MLELIYSAFGFFIILGIAESLKKFFHLPSDITRKIAHILSSILAFFLPYYLSRVELIILSILIATVLFITKNSKIFKSIHGIERATFGEIYFPLSLGLLAVFFLPSHLRAAQFGLLVLGFSDAMASIIGESFGKHFIYIKGHKKSFEGSAAFFITTCILIVIFFPSASFTVYLVGILCAIILTLLELALIYGLDNLFLPILAATLFQYVLFAMV